MLFYSWFYLWCWSVYSGGYHGGEIINEAEKVDKKRSPDPLHIIGIIKHEKVLNIMKLCRILNARDFKFCHSKHDEYKHIDDRMDGQFIKQCNKCEFHYRVVHRVIMKMAKEGQIKTDKRVFYDIINDKGDIRTKGPGRRRDLFRFIYIDDEAYRDIILLNTLDGWT